MLQHVKEFDPQFDLRPLSYSSLKAFQKSPQHFVEYRLTKKEPTPSLILGNMIDVLILTPHEYEQKYAVMPDDVKKPTSAQYGAEKKTDKTAAQIERYEGWCNENKGKIWVDAENQELAKFLAQKTFDNEKAKDLLSRVKSTQQKISWTDKATGLPLVGYKDMDGDSFIADLKSAQDGSPEGFMRAAGQFGYPLQAGTYLSAEKNLFGRFPDFFFVVVETTAPYNISVYKATADFIALGKQQYEETLQAVKFCAENNLWYQGYEFHSTTGYHQLDLPGWIKNKLNK